MTMQISELGEWVIKGIKAHKAPIIWQESGVY
jgi:hypothetical protein